MDYMPQLSPSSCSDETLIGTPDSPTKILLDGIDSLKIISMQEKNPFAVDLNLDKEPTTKHLKPPVRPQFRRRNAISNQSSNDDTIVCHGPSYGAVFGNVSGGSGNLTFESNYFASKTNKQQSNNSSSPSIAYYLSPTYGLPDNPFDSLLSPPIKEEEEEAATSTTVNVPDDVRSAFSSDESSESEERIPSSSRNHKIRKITLIRSPATFSLSTLLDHAPSPPIRTNDKNASLSAPCCGIKLIKTNQKFFDAIQANMNEDQENFKLTLPGGKEEVEQIPTFKQRKRQSSQRITLQQVALQAGHFASLRRQGLDMASR